MADVAGEVVERSDINRRAPAVASIAVYVGFDSGSDGRIKIAADWAAKFDATLIGMAGWLPGREAGGWFEYELERPEDRTDRITGELDELGERFRNLVRHKVETAEWRASVHFPREVLPAEGRAADLIVIGPRTVAEDAYHAFDAGTVLLSAGRPVLVVPDGVTANPGERLLIAWKDTREARRAPDGRKGHYACRNHRGGTGKSCPRATRRRRKVFAPAWNKSTSKVGTAPKRIDLGSTEKRGQKRRR